VAPDNPSLASNPSQPPAASPDPRPVALTKFPVPPPSVASHPTYEFAPSENAILRNLGAKMSFVGLFMLGSGLFFFAAVILRWFNISELEVELLFLTLLFVVVGIWTHRAGRDFRSAAETKGNDIAHLMDALASLLKFYTLLYILFFIVLAPFAVQAAEQANEITIETSGGLHRFSVEWATTQAERERGLMFRKSMAADHGMMFDFGDEEPVAFWMKNTPLSLDMLFIAADGTIRRIEKRATPFSEDHIPSGAPVRYVLELNGGTADRLGIAVGHRAVITPR